MPRRLDCKIPCAAALVFCLLSSVGCSSVLGDRNPPAVPQAQRPCDLPYLDKAAELPAQQDLDKPLTGDQWAQLEGQDAGIYNALFPKFNANIAWAAAHCIAKPAELKPEK